MNNTSENNLMSVAHPSGRDFKNADNDIIFLWDKTLSNAESRIINLFFNFAQSEIAEKGKLSLDGVIKVTEVIKVLGAKHTNQKWLKSKIESIKEREIILKKRSSYFRKGESGNKAVMTPFEELKMKDGYIHFKIFKSFFERYVTNIHNNVLLNTKEIKNLKRPLSIELVKYFKGRVFVGTQAREQIPLKLLYDFAFGTSLNHDTSNRKYFKRDKLNKCLDELKEFSNLKISRTVTMDWDPVIGDHIYVFMVTHHPESPEERKRFGKLQKNTLGLIEYIQATKLEIDKSDIFLPKSFNDKKAGIAIEHESIDYDEAPKLTAEEAHEDFLNSESFEDQIRASLEFGDHDFEREYLHIEVTEEVLLQHPEMKEVYSDEEIREWVIGFMKKYNYSTLDEYRKVIKDVSKKIDKPTENTIEATLSVMEKAAELEEEYEKEEK